MTYEYKSHIYLAEAVLNVKDLASQTAFYQQIIGLEILSQTETEALAAQDIYELGERVEPFILAEGSRMGHIHLSVKDSRKSSQFYQKVLGLEDKFSVPSASWIAAGDYHHHLAVNEWGGKGLVPRKQGLPGLAYYVIEVAHKEELLAIAQRAQEVDAPIKWLASSQLEIIDPDGIVTRVRLDR